MKHFSATRFSESSKRKGSSHNVRCLQARDEYVKFQARLLLTLSFATDPTGAEKGTLLDLEDRSIDVSVDFVPLTAARFHFGLCLAERQIALYVSCEGCEVEVEDWSCGRCNLVVEVARRESKGVQPGGEVADGVVGVREVSQEPPIEDDQACIHTQSNGTQLQNQVPDVPIMLQLIVDISADRVRMSKVDLPSLAMSLTATFRTRSPFLRANHTPARCSSLLVGSVERWYNQLVVFDVDEAWPRIVMHQMPSPFALQKLMVGHPLRVAGDPYSKRSSSAGFIELSVRFCLSPLRLQIMLTL